LRSRYAFAGGYLLIGEEDSFCFVELSPRPIDPEPVGGPAEDPEDEPSMFSFSLVSASRVPVCLSAFSAWNALSA
jgi:hypothetical protein